MPIKFYVTAVCFVLIFPVSCFAMQEEESAKGLDNVMFEAEYYNSTHSDRYIETYNLNAGLGFYPINNLGLYVTALLSMNQGYITDDWKPELGEMEADSAGVGMAGLVRFHLPNIGRLGFFLDASFGGIYYDDNFPPGGTTWNFISRAGGGISFQFSENASLKAGYRYMHISNGRGVSEVNPALDSQAGFAGINFKY